MISASLIWSLIGLNLIIAEFFLPSIGLLFLGLGSLTNSILISHSDLSISYQLSYTGLFSFCWLLILWWPLNKFIYAKKSSNQQGNFELIGSQVTLLSNELSPGEEGNATWSGTIMRVKLLKSIQITAIKGDILTVQYVRGNILHCIIESDKNG